MDNSINDSTKPRKTNLHVGLEGLEKEKPSFCKKFYVPLHRGCIFLEADIVQAWGPGVKYGLCFMSKPGVTPTKTQAQLCLAWSDAAAGKAPAPNSLKWFTTPNRGESGVIFPY